MLLLCRPLMLLSLVSDITILWLWPRLGLTRTSPISTELVAGKEEAFGNALVKSLPAKYVLLHHNDEAKHFALTVGLFLEHSYG